MSLIREFDIQFVAIKMEDGSLAIMQFNTSIVQGGVEWLREATDENIQAEINKTFSSVNRDGEVTWNVAVTSWRRISKEDIPTTREFRNAWKDTGSAIEHDMVKCRGIHLGHLRAERAKLLPELDVQWMRAFSTGNTISAAVVEAKRQALRDMPQTFSANIQAAATVDALKAIVLTQITEAV